MILQEQIGQCIMVGLSGTELDSGFASLVRQYKIGNVVLFKHNIESITQLKKLCADIQNLVLRETGYPAIIGIDQEGGSVTRLSDDAVNVPAAMAISATGDPENAYKAACLTAHELRAIGIQLNFAPSADINANPDNPIVGARSFGETPEQVIPYVLRSLDGYYDNQILAVVKHFPGHGDTFCDSHISLPRIDKTAEELEQTDLSPFRAAISHGCAAIMTSHILFPALEPEKLPATMSRRILTDLLREKLGFQGLIVTDCMEMDAIARFYGTVEGAVAAIAAGVDMVLISHNQEIAAQSAEKIQEAVQLGKIDSNQLSASIKRILMLKNKFCLTPNGRAGLLENKIESMKLRRKTITLYGGEIPHLGDRPFFVGCADFRAGGVSNEASAITFSNFLQDKFGGRALVTEKDPEDEQIIQAVQIAKQCSSIFVCTYNGHLFSGQQKLVKALATAQIPMAVFALRNPYDLRYVPEGAGAVAAWDYSRMTLELIGEILEGKLIPQGKPPVHLGDML